MTGIATRTLRRAAACILAAGAVLWTTSGPALRAAGNRKPNVPKLEGTTPAPEFPPGKQWLNTDRAIRLRQLRGKIVLLDFWTYCCINCMHVLPDLKRLERKYPKELVVIGVHSAKFTTEKDTDNIRQAILRYEIEHPVVNDADMGIWRSYGARAWPTLMLIDPAGKLVGYHSGEGVFDVFDPMVAAMIRHFDARKLLDRTPVTFRLERDKAAEGLLSFPGKVLADEKAGLLFVADSNHNRIVAVSLADGAVRHVIGSGARGLTDGGFDEAAFHHPQGMAFDRKAGVLYVADTENHAIRKVDLPAAAVTTIAGTGRQARRSNVAGFGAKTDLNSPWALVLAGGKLFIAMAGSHQIWRMDLAKGFVEPHAGSGRENRTDGPHLDAALAQPSGLATDGKKLYFADSEVSAIRSADVSVKGRVETLVGGELFEFGDRDAKGLEARLQHPLGVALDPAGGLLYVADTYNNRIKRLRPADREIQAFLGTGRAGRRDGKGATFDEPGGLSLAGGKLYIADTNNHVIRVADLKTRRVATLRIRRPARLRPRPPERARPTETALPAQTIRPGKTALRVALDLPAGCKLTPEAPSTVTLRGADGKVLAVGDGRKTTLEATKLPIDLPARAAAGTADLHVEFVLYYCRQGAEALCYFREARLRVPVVVKDGAAGRKLEVRFAPPKP